MRSEASGGRFADINGKDKSSQCDRRCIDAAPCELSHEVVAIHTGHGDVAHYHVEPFSREDLESVLDARSRFHTCRSAVQYSLEYEQGVRLIVDNQNAEVAEIGWREPTGSAAATS